MSTQTFAELGHGDLVDEPDDLEHLADADPEVDHDAHAGWCGQWCGAEPPTPMDERGRTVTPWPGREADAARERTAMPEPEVRARPATPEETPDPAVEMLALAEAAGWTAMATFARGPRMRETSPCPVCRVWVKITDGGKLTKHGRSAADCEVLGPVTEAGVCPCGRQLKPLKRGGWSSAKHKTPPGCENTAIDPAAPSWQTADSVVVRATSPRGHRAVAVWMAGKADGAWLALAGDRPRPVGVDDLKACLRRAGAQVSPRDAPGARQDGRTGRSGTRGRVDDSEALTGPSRAAA